MPVLDLPEPAEWRRRRWLGPLLLVIGAGVAIGYGALGVVATARASYLTAAVTSGFAVSTLLFIAALVPVMGGHTVERTRTDATGLTMVPDRRFTLLVTAAILVALPSLVIFTVFAPLGRIDFATGRILQVAFPVLGAFAVIVTVAGLVTAWRRGGIGHVTLSPVMIENADVLSVRRFEWDDVVDVVGHAESKKASRAVVLRLRDGGEEVIGNANVYVRGGAALYWLVRHYWKHPEDRDELVDARASKRWQEGRFDVS
ncbi:hypothetical protein [Mycobacterium sp. 236(2023)]|uniref:hypothetical protein n=1 Tax=Mycobacterium sp. 236(2023) TaxID=3038163 RepID=UPI0024153257|nr:hypothetical protein [Mycobacterium sp. 236(2023)]MDG4663673.1 hypothetical protein [Mycobacterium sp. 236(2023)]